MHKLSLSLIFYVFYICCIAQSSQSVRYFKNSYLTKETDKEKASFSETITKTIDTITTEVKDIKTNKVIRSHSYKGEEPVGIWTIQTSSGTMELNYNFTVIYSEDFCDTNIPGMETKDYFNNNDSIGYVAPKSTNIHTSVQKFIMNRIIYPMNALRKGLQGASIIYFTITPEGRIENITARKGTSILFDKEAIRVIKLLAFSSPATLNGKLQGICVIQRINFSLDY